MRRRLATLSLAGVLGLLLTAADAQACHKRKAPCGACEPAPVPCATVVVVPPPAPCPPPAPVPCPPPAPVCEKPVKKGCGTCGDRHGLLGGLRCHKKTKAAACATPVLATIPVYHAVPQYAGPSPQGFPTPQGFAAPQGAPVVVPGKGSPTF